MMWLAENWLAVWLWGAAGIYLPGLWLAGKLEDGKFDGVETLLAMAGTAAACIFWPIIVGLACVALVCLPVFGLGYWILNSGKVQKKVRHS